jgi:peptidyl-Asp metalloendopeptidase
MPCRRYVSMAVALALCAPMLAAAQTPLFSPLPLSNMQRQLDPTLDSILDEPASRLVARVTGTASLIQEDADTLRINLAPGIDLTASRDEAHQIGDDIVTWQGHWNDAGSLASSARSISGDTALDTAANQVVLVRHGSMLTGSLHVNGELYALRPLMSGGHAIYHVDTSAMPPDHPTDFVAQAPERSDGDAGTPTPMDRSTTHAMIVFSDDAMRTIADPVGFAHLAITETNQGYANSGIRHRLTMIDTVYASEYRDTRDARKDLGALTETRDGVLDWVHQRRDEKGADLVTLIVGQGTNACGVGWLNAGAGNAFTVVDKGCALGYYTYGHELGHVYGATHNPEAGGSGPYSYGYGYYNQAAKARTVMSYECPNGCKRYNVWSSPNNTINGVRAGNAQKNDNTRVLNERAATVAAFR